MIKQLIGIFLLFVFFTGSAQVDLNKTYSIGVGYSDFISIEEKFDTLYSVVRFFDFDSIQAMKIIKMDTTGVILNELLLKDTISLFSTYQNFSGFQITNQNKILFWGNKYNVPRPGISYLILTDTNLDSYEIKEFIPTKPYPEYRFQGATSLLATEEAIYLLGTVQEEDYTSDALVIKTDLEGNELWRKTYGVAGDEEYPYCIKKGHNNEILIAGARSSSFELPITEIWGYEWIMSLDTAGQILWEWQGTDTGLRGAIRSLDIKDGSYYYTSGQIFLNGAVANSTRESYIAARDKDFNLLWEQKMPIQPSSQNFLYNSTLNADSTAIIAIGEKHFFSPGVHFKVKLDGHIEYYREDTLCADGVDILEQGNNYHLYDIAALSSGSTVSCGSADVKTATGWGTRAWLIKISASGIPDTLYCGAFVPTKTPEYTGLKLDIYPNPSIDQVKIELPALEKGHRLRCYNLAGKLQSELDLNGLENPSLEVADWPSGMYVVQVLSADGRLLAVGRFVRL